MPPQKAFLGPFCPQGAHEGMRGFPRATPEPPEPLGAFSDNLGFRTLGGSPDTVQKPIKTGVPKPRTYLNSKSIQAVFLVRMVLKTPQDHP